LTTIDTAEDRTMQTELLLQTIEFEHRRAVDEARLRRLVAVAARCCTVASNGLRARVSASVQALLGRLRLAS
jgi:hypothetical protein